jgi:hypothetical protein
LEFVADRGGKSQAARRFSVDRGTCFVWLGEPANDVPGKPGPKTGRKIDRELLCQAVQALSDLMLEELRAALTSFVLARPQPGAIQEALGQSQKPSARTWPLL